MGWGGDRYVSAGHVRTVPERQGEGDTLGSKEGGQRRYCISGVGCLCFGPFCWEIFLNVWLSGKSPASLDSCLKHSPVCKPDFQTDLWSLRSLVCLLGCLLLAPLLEPSSQDCTPGTTRGRTRPSLKGHSGSSQRVVSFSSPWSTKQRHLVSNLHNPKPNCELG